MFISPKILCFSERSPTQANTMVAAICTDESGPLKTKLSVRAAPPLSSNNSHQSHVTSSEHEPIGQEEKRLSNEESKSSLSHQMVFENKQRQSLKQQQFLQQLSNNNSNINNNSSYGVFDGNEENESCDKGIPSASPSMAKYDCNGASTCDNRILTTSAQFQSSVGTDAAKTTMEVASWTNDLENIQRTDHDPTATIAVNEGLMRLKLPLRPHRAKRSPNGKHIESDSAQQRQRRPQQKLSFRPSKTIIDPSFIHYPRWHHCCQCHLRNSQKELSSPVTLKHFFHGLIDHNLAVVTGSNVYVFPEDKLVATSSLPNPFLAYLQPNQSRINYSNLPGRDGILRRGRRRGGGSQERREAPWSRGALFAWTLIVALMTSAILPISASGFDLFSRQRPG